MSSSDPNRAMRTMRWAAIGLALVVGWFFIAWQNDFHLTAPVIFVWLGYLAVVALIVNMWKTGAIVVAPEQAGEEAWERPIGPRDELDKEKRTLLKAIKEAEFDHQMGKLSKADADSMIATYRARAIAVIKELDAMEPRTPVGDAYRGEMLTKRERIEREVKARLELQQKRPKKKGGKAAAKAQAKAETKAETTETKAETKAEKTTEVTEAAEPAKPEPEDAKSADAEAAK